MALEQPSSYPTQASLAAHVTLWLGHYGRRDYRLYGLASVLIQPEFLLSLCLIAYILTSCNLESLLTEYFGI